ncbi:MAG: hypothetical protein AAB932_01620 [Patescibacteria group bacterium]
MSSWNETGSERREPPIARNDGWPKEGEIEMPDHRPPAARPPK